MTQRQCDVVAAIEMFIDQRLQRYVGQNIAAVSTKRFLSQLGFNVLDAAAGLEQNRFIYQHDWSIALSTFSNLRLESFGQAMSINNERLNPDVDQMIDR